LPTCALKNYNKEHYFVIHEIKKSYFAGITTVQWW